MQLNLPQNFLHKVFFFTYGIYLIPFLLTAWCQSPSSCWCGDGKGTDTASAEVASCPLCLTTDKFSEAYLQESQGLKWCTEGENKSRMHESVGEWLLVQYDILFPLVSFHCVHASSLVQEAGLGFRFMDATLRNALVSMNGLPNVQHAIVQKNFDGENFAFFLHFS